MLKSSPEQRYIERSASNAAGMITLHVANWKIAAQGRFTKADIDALGLPIFRMREENDNAYRTIHGGIWSNLGNGTSGSVRVYKVDRGMRVPSSGPLAGQTVIDFHLQLFATFNYANVAGNLSTIDEAVVPTGFRIADSISLPALATAVSVPPGPGSILATAYKAASPQNYEVAGGGQDAEFCLPDVGDPYGLIFDAIGPTGFLLNMWLRRTV